jgi:hypothetical protein
MPYKAIRAFDDSKGPLLVMSIVGNQEFQFDDERALKKG